MGVEQLTPVHPELQVEQFIPLEFRLHVHLSGAEHVPPFKHGCVQTGAKQSDPCHPGQHVRRHRAELYPT